MRLLFAAAQGVAAYEFFTIEQQSLMWVAIIGGIISLWSWGVLMNSPETPGFWSVLNFLTAISGVALVIWAFVAPTPS